MSSRYEAHISIRGRGAGAPPVNIVAPHIAGRPSLSSLLSVSNGTWTGASTYSYQWFNDGVAIGGATASTYQPVDTDLGKVGRQANPVISAIVTAHGTGGDTAASADNTVQFDEATVLAPYGFVEWQRSDSWQLGAGVQIASATDRSGAANNLAQAAAGNRPTRVVNDVGLFAAEFALAGSQYFTGPLLSALLTVDGSSHGTAFWSLSARQPIDSNADAAVALGYNLPGQGVGRAGGYAWLQSLGKTGGGQLYAQVGAYSTVAAAGKGAQGNVTAGQKTLVESWLDASNRQLHLRLGWNAQIDGDVMADTIASVTDPTVWGAAAPGGNYLSEDLSEMFVCRTRPSAVVVADVRASLSVRQNVSSLVQYTPTLAQWWANGWDSPQAYGRFVSDLAYFAFDTTADTFDLAYYVNSVALNPRYGSIAIFRDDSVSKTWGGVLVGTIEPASIVGAYRTTIATGGGAGLNKRLFIVASARSGDVGATPQSVYVDVSKPFAFVTEPVGAKAISIEGTGGLRLSDDGWKAVAGVLSMDPADVALRTAMIARVAAMGPEGFLVVSMDTNESRTTNPADLQVVNTALLQQFAAIYGAGKVGIITLLRQGIEDATIVAVRAADAAAAAAAGVTAIDGLTLGAEGLVASDITSDGIHLYLTGQTKLAGATGAFIAGAAVTQRMAIYSNSLWSGSGINSTVDNQVVLASSAGCSAIARKAYAGV